MYLRKLCKMQIIKRLHIFLLKSFLPVFAMTFFIVLFIVLMQFLWRYIDDLVGKGLEIKVIAELFFYAAICMVPTALPLAILLASLMTFGNLGERSELTAMKAAGISLLRTMMPLIILISGVSVGAFFFQNDILPKAQVKMWTLLFSMKQKSPELEIPEKAFYDQIPGYSVYVDSKNAETGILRDIMIYDMSKGFGNATVLRADSARLAFTADQSHLYLHLWDGEQFDNMQGNTSASSGMGRQNQPFRRETFADKELLIQFDKNFNRLDEGGMRKQYVGKNIAELQHTIDSVNLRIDSIGTRYSYKLRTKSFGGVEPQIDSVGNPKPLVQMKLTGSEPSIDVLISRLGVQERRNLYKRVETSVQQARMDIQFKAESMADDNKTIRRHEIELMKKFTLSVACLLFFFIGAPLGAIIRKGGLGTPLVVSVLIFIIYYIIDNTGYKLARDGKWVVWQGMWISTFILAPLGVYVTYKAMNDSAVFSADAWRRFITKVLGIKLTRRIEFKEIIMTPISLADTRQRIVDLLEAAKTLAAKCRRPQWYGAYWWKGFDNREIGKFAAQLDGDCKDLTNCTDLSVVNKLLDYPLIRRQWLYRPAPSHLWSIIAFVLFPISIPLWILGMVKQHYLAKDLRKVVKVAGEELSLVDYAISKSQPETAPESGDCDNASADISRPDDSSASASDLSDQSDDSSDQF